MNERQRLNRIYDKVPTFRCGQGCSECCGPVNWHPAEDRNIRRYLAKHGRTYQVRRLDSMDVLAYVQHGDASGIICPYVKDHRCTIYLVRPLICRLQGVYPEKLPCPFVKPERVLTKNEIEQLFEELDKL